MTAAGVGRGRGRFRLCAPVLAALLIVACSVSCSGKPDPPPPWGPPPQLTPPMGWNSWNSGIGLTEQSVEATIDAMISSGMRDAGYRYVNLDAGWAAPTRDHAGNLRANPTRFPGGIAAVARYAHDRGMLLGLYAGPYSEVCGLDPPDASVGHEADDARQFAAWGVDYLKYDWCRNDTNHADEVRAFTAMRDALGATGRRIIYSINPTRGASALGSTYDWSGIADMARTTGDLVPLWQNPWAAGGRLGVVDQLMAAGPVASRSRPGHWNDPDMLVVGVSWPDFVSRHPGMLASLAVPGTLSADQLEQAEMRKPITPQLFTAVGAQRSSLTDVEQRAHFSLWAMLAAPLLAGNDIRSMSEQTRAILTNRDVIAVDQDPLVIQAEPLPGESRILVKPLADGSIAVALFNPDSQPASIGTGAAAIGLRNAPCYTVHDLWTHADATTDGRIHADDVPVHGVVALRITAGCG